jgi:hypothetical protein
MNAIAAVRESVYDVLNSWRKDGVPDAWDRQPPTDKEIVDGVKSRLGSRGSEIAGNMRRCASHVFALNDRERFRNDPCLLHFLLSERVQDRYAATVGSAPRGATVAALVADVHGYDFFRIETVEAWSTIVQPRYHFPPAVTAEIDLIVRQRIAKGACVLIPEARYDEILIEIITGLWLGLYFLGERYDTLWSVVARLAANDTGGLPTGCAVFKAYGDVYRDVRQAAEEMRFRTRPDGNRFLASNFRVRAVVKWSVLFGEAFFIPGKGADGGQGNTAFDLTPPDLRSLGALYLYWQALRYVRTQLPITLLMRRQRLYDVVHSQDESRWPEAVSWFKLAFGKPDAPYIGPQPYDEEPQHKICAWYRSPRNMPQAPVADLYLSRHTSVLAVNDATVDDLDLHNAVVGPRMGAASGGYVPEPRSGQATEDQGAPSVAGELPFSGRRLHGDLLASYNYAFRQLSVRARQRLEEAAGGTNLWEHDIVDVIALVYGDRNTHGCPDSDIRAATEAAGTL